MKWEDIQTLVREGKMRANLLLSVHHGASFFGTMRDLQLEANIVFLHMAWLAVQPRAQSLYYPFEKRDLTIHLSTAHEATICGECMLSFAEPSLGKLLMAYTGNSADKALTITDNYADVLCQMLQLQKMLQLHAKLAN